MLRIRQNAADIIGTTERICRASDREQFVFPGDRVSTVPDILGALIGSIEQAECHLAGGSRQLASPKWIDDAPGMNTSAHVAVAAGARNVEQAHAFHKERTFLGIEDRESLVHLNLERVTFHLAEVGIDCGVQSDVGRDSVLRTKSHVRFFIGRIPSSGSSARLADAERDSGPALAGAPPLAGVSHTV